MTATKILFLDIETAPSLGWVWGKWQQNVIAFQEEWYMLSFAWKWLGERSVSVKALCDYKGYNHRKHDDSRLIADLWCLLDEADVIIAHNGDKFDIRKTNSRFVFHKLPPPSPYKTVDTYKIAKKYFRFDGNRLGDLGVVLGIGGKLPTTGFHLWRGCMEGDLSSWERMKNYNARDITLLEKVYLAFRSWHTGHPKLSLYSKPDACPTCQSNKVQRRGLVYLRTTKRQRWNCQSCGSWYQGKPE